MNIGMRKCFSARTACWLALAFLVFEAACSLSFGQEVDSFFEREVAPILNRRCLDCHHNGKDSGGISFEESGSARLDDIIKPGNSNDSYLVKLITPDEFGNAAMPKQRNGLTESQIETIRKWIDDGGKWPDGFRIQPGNQVNTEWWSLRPLVPIVVPDVDEPETWARNGIDNFVLRKLSEQGLSPSPPADPRTVVRRLYFDLTGLPPPIDVIESYAANPDDGHYERIVDELLASPQYGERWARHWLDLVHYGDTHGFDKDKIRPNAWRYRDWVIRRLNEDLPYTDFVRHQIAGDVLFPDDREAIVATGMIVAGPFDWVGQIEVAEGSLEKKRIRNLDRDDMVATVMNAFVSTTAQCARCHDHKFDPVTQEDYYRLQSLFAGIDRAERTIPLEANDQAEMDRLIMEQKRIQESLELLESEIVKAVGPLDQQIGELQMKVDALPGPLDKSGSTTNGYHSQFATLAETPKSVSVQLKTPAEVGFVVIYPARPTDFPDTPGFAFPVRWKLELVDAQEKTSLLADWQACDFPNPGDRFMVLANYQPGIWSEIHFTATRLAARSVGDDKFALAVGEIQAFNNSGLVTNAASVTTTDSIDSGLWSHAFLVDGQTSRNRLAIGDSQSMFAATLKQRAELEESMDRLQAERLACVSELGLGHDDEIGKLKQSLVGLDPEILEVKQRGVAFCAATQFAGEGSFQPTGGVAREVFVLDRGNESTPKNDLGLVQPGAISGLEHLQHHFQLPADHSEGDRRVALADWIVDHDNPLTWRSIVNRVWQHHFGSGLAATANDFGRMGSPPSHPELIDWLATRFRDSGGSLKQLHQLMVMSATYRQSSAHDTYKSEIDGGNQFLWRMNRRRLDVEQIRDAMLVVAGQMDTNMYGPGYRPFELIDDHSPRYEYDKVDMDDPTLYRRSIYRFIVRSVPQPFFETLDCADPSQITDIRNESTTALQALALMNNRLSLHLADRFAGSLKTADMESQVRSAVRQIWGRDPNEMERQVLVELGRTSGIVAVCRTLLNSNEFVFVE